MKSMSSRMARHLEGRLSKEDISGTKKEDYADQSCTG